MALLYASALRVRMEVQKELGVAGGYPLLFLEKKNWQILIIFSTKFATKIIESPHMADIGESCCDTAQKRQKSALFMFPGNASILRIYSLEHKDIPTYKNLAKIPHIQVSGCFHRGSSTSVFSTVLS